MAVNNGVVDYNTPAAPAASTATSQGYQDAINKQLAANAAPIDPNSAVVRAQTDPYRVAAERGLGQNRNAIAEANYAGGNVNTGGAAQQQQRAREDASQAEATNTGQVVGAQEAARQANLATYTGMGTNAALQQQGVTNQAGQFGDTLGLNYAQLAQGQGQFGVTSKQNQDAINNALEIAKMNNQLGYAQNALGYYNTDTNYSTNTRQQDITAAGGM